MTGKRRSWRILLSAVGLLAMISAAAAESPTQAPKPAQIDRNGVLILIRSALLALDHANKTGNYTVLRDIGAPGFQSNTAARLGDIFVKLRNDNLDLSGVAVIEPQLNLLPQIEANGMMRMAGFFPSVPTQVNFDLLFAPVNGQWRLFGISVGVGSSAPVAPEPSAAKKLPATPNGAKPAVAAKSAPGTKPAAPDNKPAESQQPK
ncbi:hypothetical protein [Bradyrhizobium sp. CCBAU 051011]|jgi:hypothetical protein|uniref:hypothetical protein n=1 Tax=Bradyrhizobium sp. CCBAU 051011 TaxID=858422 RepID=UPI001FEE7EAE|nr:hypothetical protein [Bradyrhizobium sp. CCBAU 051011]